MTGLLWFLLGASVGGSMGVMVMGWLMEEKIKVERARSFIKGYMAATEEEGFEKDQ